LNPKPSEQINRWRELLELGERLLAQPTLATQRDVILDTAERLVGGQGDLWLSDSLCRLQSQIGSLQLTPAPPTELMLQALESQQPSASPGGGGPAIAVPLLVNSTVIGVLQIDRPASVPFDDDEIELLEGLAVQSAVSVRTSCQVAIERWRVEQLSLVRQVSAQVARLLNIWTN